MNCLINQIIVLGILGVLLCRVQCDNRFVNVRFVNLRVCIHTTRVKS